MHLPLVSDRYLFTFENSKNYKPNQKYENQKSTEKSPLRD
jgi:hypothetical protein